MWMDYPKTRKDGKSSLADVNNQFATGHITPARRPPMAPPGAGSGRPAPPTRIRYRIARARPATRRDDRPTVAIIPAHVFAPFPIACTRCVAPPLARRMGLPVAGAGHGCRSLVAAGDGAHRPRSAGHGHLQRGRQHRQRAGPPGCQPLPAVLRQPACGDHAEHRFPRWRPAGHQLPADTIHVHRTFGQPDSDQAASACASCGLTGSRSVTLTRADHAIHRRGRPVRSGFKNT